MKPAVLTKSSLSFFYAEKLKYHHTCMLGLTFFMPLAVVFLAAWLTGSYFSVDAYNWWYIGLYPGFLGVVSSVIGRKDLEKKNHTIWSLPCEMERIWDAKVLVGVMESGTAVFILTVLTIICEKGIEGIFHVSMAAVFSFQTKLAAGVVLWLTTLWQIPFCLLLSQKMGTFVMLLIHMISYSVLAGTMSLKPWFFLLPGAITSRLMCPVIGVLPNGLLFEPGQMTYSLELGERSSLGIGIFSALLWFCFFWFAGRKWFGKQVEK